MRLTRYVIPVIVVVLASLLCGHAWAHDPASHDPAEQRAAMLSLAVLAAFGGIYLLGSRKHAPALYQVLCFLVAFLLCIFAVSGPLDEWAETNEAAHMVQHMMFMVIIAPLWVFSRPLPQLIACAGKPGLSLWRPVARLIRYPMITAYIHGVVIWFWHVPYFYILALNNPWWHVVEHACFLMTAGLFWWAVLKSSERRAHWSFLALLFTLMHTGFLGALLTFAPEPLYGTGRNLAAQQLAGLVMWVAGGVPYLMASVWMAYCWYQKLQRGMNTAHRNV